MNLKSLSYMQDALWGKTNTLKTPLSQWDMVRKWKKSEIWNWGKGSPSNKVTWIKPEQI